MTKPLGLPVYFLRELTFEIAQNKGLKVRIPSFVGRTIGTFSSF